MSDWKTEYPTDLEQAIMRFKVDFPGWWFSVCECEKSCDASCAPTRDSEHIHLVDFDDRLDKGVHIDLPQPSTLAQALDEARKEAHEAVYAAMHYIADRF